MTTTSTTFQESVKTPSPPPSSPPPTQGKQSNHGIMYADGYPTLTKKSTPPNSYENIDILYEFENPDQNKCDISKHASNSNSKDFQSLIKKIASSEKDFQTSLKQWFQTVEGQFQT